MTRFKDRPFNVRMDKLGDEAETIFEFVWTTAFDRYGLNRPKSSMRDMPAFARYTPDYVTSSGYVEVQGCGRHQTWAFKLEKVAALTEWEEKWDVRWFLWDGVNRRFATVAHGWVKDRTIAEVEAARVHHFPDNQKAYINIGTGEVDVVLWTYLDPGSGPQDGDSDAAPS